MSPAGTSVSAPTWRNSSVMKAWQKRMISPSLLPFGSKSEPPLRAHGQAGEGIFEYLFKAEELMTEALTVG